MRGIVPRAEAGGAERVRSQTRDSKIGRWRRCRICAASCVPLLLGSVARSPQATGTARLSTTAVGRKGEAYYAAVLADPVASSIGRESHDKLANACRIGHIGGRRCAFPPYRVLTSARMRTNRVRTLRFSGPDRRDVACNHIADISLLLRCLRQARFAGKGSDSKWMEEIYVRTKLGCAEQRLPCSAS